MRSLGQKQAHLVFSIGTRRHSLTIFSLAPLAVYLASCFTCGDGLVGVPRKALAQTQVTAEEKQTAQTQQVGQQGGQAQPGAQAGQVQQATGQKPGASASAQAEEQKFRPRLPNYYAQVVTEEQRQKIYDIQRKYFSKIEALRRQLEALIAERDKEIEAVLTSEQKAKIEQLRKEGAERRAARRGEAAASETQE